MLGKVWLQSEPSRVREQPQDQALTRGESDPVDRGGSSSRHPEEFDPIPLVEDGPDPFDDRSFRDALTWGSHGRRALWLKIDSLFQRDRGSHTAAAGSTTT